VVVTREHLLGRGAAIELASLAKGCVVGTASLRRMCQLRARRPDLKYVGVRGNLGTRLGKLRRGDMDALILAAAGLSRLGSAEQGQESVEGTPIAIEVSLPAVGQGTLAIEVRSDAPAWLSELLSELDDPSTRLATVAERSMSCVLSGNCHSPIAGFARVEADASRLCLQGMVAAVEGQSLLHAGAECYLRPGNSQARLAQASELGEEVAQGLLSQGAKKLIDEAARHSASQLVSSNGSAAKMPWLWKAIDDAG